MDLCNSAIGPAEALSGLGRLESLTLSRIPNLATLAFAKNLSRLQSLNVRDSAIWDLSVLGKNESIRKLIVSRSKIRDIRSLEAEES